MNQEILNTIETLCNMLQYTYDNQVKEIIGKAIDNLSQIKDK